MSTKLNEPSKQSTLTPTETQNRLWKLDTFNAKGEPVYVPKELTNNDIIEALKQVLYEGKTTKFTVTLK